MRRAVTLRNGSSNNCISLFRGRIAASMPSYVLVRKSLRLLHTQQKTFSAASHSRFSVMDIDCPLSPSCLSASYGNHLFNHHFYFGPLWRTELVRFGFGGPIRLQHRNGQLLEHFVVMFTCTDPVLGPPCKRTGQARGLVFLNYWGGGAHEASSDFSHLTRFIHVFCFPLSHVFRIFN